MANGGRFGRGTGRVVSEGARERAGRFGAPSRKVVRPRQPIQQVQLSREELIQQEKENRANKALKDIDSEIAKTRNELKLVRQEKRTDTRDERIVILERTIAELNSLKGRASTGDFDSKDLIQFARERAVGQRERKELRKQSVEVTVSKLQAQGFSRQSAERIIEEGGLTGFADGRQPTQTEIALQQSLPPDLRNLRPEEIQAQQSFSTRDVRVSVKDILRSEPTGLERIRRQSVDFDTFPEPQQSIVERGQEFVSGRVERVREFFTPEPVNFERQDTGTIIEDRVRRDVNLVEPIVPGTIFFKQTGTFRGTPTGEIRTAKDFGEFGEGGRTSRLATIEEVQAFELSRTALTEDNTSTDPLKRIEKLERDIRQTGFATRTFSGISEFEKTLKQVENFAVSITRIDATTTTQLPFAQRGTISTIPDERFFIRTEQPDFVKITNEISEGAVREIVPDTLRELIADVALLGVGAGIGFGSKVAGKGLRFTGRKIAGESGERLLIQVGEVSATTLGTAFLVPEVVRVSTEFEQASDLGTKTEVLTRATKDVALLGGGFALGGKAFDKVIDIKTKNIESIRQIDFATPDTEKFIRRDIETFFERDPLGRFKEQKFPIIDFQIFEGVKYPKLKRGQTAGQLREEFFKKGILPGEKDFPKAFTASPQRFDLLTKTGKGTSEVPGLFSSAQLNPNFLQIGRRKPFGLFGALDSSTPTALRLKIKKIEFGPGIKASTVKVKGPLEKLKPFFEDIEGTGKTILPFSKTEKEIITASGSDLIVPGKKLFFEYKGRPVLIQEGAVIPKDSLLGLPKSVQKKIDISLKKGDIQKLDNFISSSSQIVKGSEINPFGLGSGSRISRRGVSSSFSIPSSLGRISSSGRTSRRSISSSGRSLDRSIRRFTSGSSVGSLRRSGSSGRTSRGGGRRSGSSGRSSTRFLTIRPGGSVPPTFFRFNLEPGKKKKRKRKRKFVEDIALVEGFTARQLGFKPLKIPKSKLETTIPKFQTIGTRRLPVIVR